MVPEDVEPGAEWLQFLHTSEHSGRLEQPDGEAHVVNPACGDELSLSVRVRGSTIREARFEVRGCAAATAAGAAVAAMLEGCPLGEVGRRVTPETLDAALGGLPRFRRHAAVLGAEAACQVALDALARRSD